MLHDGTIRDVCFLDEGTTPGTPGTGQATSLLSAGAGDCLVKLTDCAAGRLVRTFAGHTDAVFTLFSAYSCAQHCFISAGADKIARFWDLRTQSPVQTFASPTSSPFGAVCPLAHFSTYYPLVHLPTFAHAPLEKYGTCHNGTSWDYRMLNSTIMGPSSSSPGVSFFSALPFSQ